MHQPVLYQAIINALHPHREGRYIDCTVGAGGHAFGILKSSNPNGILLGLDVDPYALSLAEKKLSSFGDRAILVKSSYTKLKEQLGLLGWDSVDGVLLDLGVSSMQFDTPERGFSFRSNAPLDMRFDPTDSDQQTGAELVNALSPEQLADILYNFGDERKSRQIARVLVKERPIETTQQLARLVSKVVKGGRIHPATRTFQALRIAVNRELEALTSVLPQAVDSLKSGGCLAVISFHSLEDRIVKHYFRDESHVCICPPGQPMCTCEHQASVRLITRKPIRPSKEEINLNSRARSALLRVVEKI